MIVIDYSIKESREEVRRHLNCKHEVVGDTSVSTYGWRVSGTPVCWKCSMVVLWAAPEGAVYRLEE